MLFSLGLQAQYYPIQKFTVKDGLPHSNIFRIYQDKKGFLWLATDYGLSRYDGRQFVNYLTYSDTLSSCIMSVAENRKGQIWLSTYKGGLEYLDGDSIRSAYGNKLPINIMYCQFDVNGAWVMERTGDLYRLQATHVTPYLKGEGPGFRKMIPYAGGTLFATDSGLYFSYAGEKPSPYLPAISRQKVYAIQEDREHALWIALRNEIIQLKNKQVIARYPLGNTSDISDMLVDRKINVWVAIPGRGIFLKTLEAKGFTDVTGLLQLDHILVNDLLEDDKGNIWIATHGSGLYCIQNLDILNYPVQQSGINNYTKAINQWQGHIYQASIGTVCALAGQRISPLRLKSVSNIDFIYFIAFREHHIILGTPAKLIIRDLYAPYAEHFITSPGAISFLEGNKGTLLIGTFNGLYSYSKKGLICKALRARRINKMVKDNSGHIYFATDSGAILFDHGRYQLLPGIPKVAVYDLLPDHQGRVWFATDEGVYRKEGQAIRLVSVSENPKELKSTTLAEDRNGNVWIGSMNGLYRYEAGNVACLDMSSGLITNEVLSLFCDSDNNLWVGTVNGISRIGKEAINISKTAPKVYITEAIYDHTRLLFPQWARVKSTENLQLKFSAIELPSADKIEYQYCIKGLNDDWYSTRNAALELPSLPAGNYTLMVRARLPAERWGQPASLSLQITAPFWKASWFYTLEVLSTALLIYLLLRWQWLRINRKKRKDALIRNKMIYLKEQALAAMINPHFVFNCLNSIQSFIQMNEREQAKKYLVQFAKLIRITLNHSQETFISLENEIKRLQLYLEMEKVRFGEKLHYSIEVDPSIDLPTVQLPNMILQPYIENAIKHGIMPLQLGGHISISIYRTGNDKLQILIRDNGLGLEHSLESKPIDTDHRSLGMQLTANRLRLLEQIYERTYQAEVSEIKNELGISKGTQVSFCFDLRMPEKSMETIS